MEKPIIAVSMGDAAGIGPELVAKVLSRPDTHARCRPIVVGDDRVMRDACRLSGATMEVRQIERLAEATFDPQTLNILRPAGFQVPDVPPGTLDAAMGEAAAHCMLAAYDLAVAGEVQGVVL